MIAGSYKGDRHINITGIDKVHLKCDCINGSIVNGVREPILYSFALTSPPGHKINKEPGVELFKRLINLFRLISHFILKTTATKPLILITKRYRLPAI